MSDNESYIGVHISDEAAEILAGICVDLDLPPWIVVERAIRLVGTLRALHRFDGFQGEQNNPIEGAIW